MSFSPVFVDPEDVTEFDLGGFMLSGIDVSKKPIFSVSEVAKVFFGRSDHWVRWAETNGKMMLDGKPFDIPRNDNGTRVFDLRTVEQMAHALAQTGVINGEQLGRAMGIVKLVAQIYGYYIGESE